jgi:AcrR family transcriptional regulator
MNTILRNQQTKEQIRNSIIQAALTLFLNEGFEHVSMRKIADVIQYTPTTIYHYFQNKEELLQELFKIGFAKFNLSLRTIFYETLDKTSEQRISAMLHAYIGFSLEEPHYHQLIFSKNIHRVTACMQTSFGLIDKESYEGMFLLIQVVKTLIPTEKIENRSSMELAFLLWSAVNGYTLTLLPMHRLENRETIQQNANQFVDLLLRGVLNQSQESN